MPRLIGMMLVWLVVALLVGPLISILTQLNGPDLEIMAQGNTWLYPWRWPIYNLLTLAVGVALGRMLLKGSRDSLYTAIWGFMLYRVFFSTFLVAYPAGRPALNLLADMGSLSLVMLFVAWRCRGNINGGHYALDSGVYLVLLRTSLLLATVAGGLSAGVSVPSPVLLAAVLTGLMLAMVELWKVGPGRHYLVSGLLLSAIALAELFWRGSSGPLPAALILEILLSRILLPPLVVWTITRLLLNPRLRLIFNQFSENVGKE